MHSQRKRLLGAALALLFLANAAPAQDNSARGLIREGRADGLIVEVLDERTGQPQGGERRYRQGDSIRLSLSPSLDGYVYLINVTPRGERRLLYPRGHEPNQVARGQRQYFPGTGQPALVFDGEPGRETIEIVMSRQPIPRLEAVRNGSATLANAADAGIPASAYRDELEALGTRVLNLEEQQSRQAKSMAPLLQLVGMNSRGIVRPDGVTWDQGALPPDGLVHIVITLTHD